MNCPKCGTENPESKKFCRKCGVRLVKTCPQCASEIVPEDDFCGDCGHDLRKPKEAKSLDYNQASFVHSEASCRQNPHHTQLYRGRTKARNDPFCGRCRFDRDVRKARP